MSGFKKFVHILFSMLLILFSLVMFFTAFNFGQVDHDLRKFMMDEMCFYIFIIMGALVLIGAIFIMFKATLSDDLSDFLISKDRDGEVMVSTGALEDTVRCTANKYEDIRTSNANVRVNSSSEPYMNHDIGVGVRGIPNIAGLGKNIKEDIRLNLENLSGYKVKDITVKFLDLTKSISERIL